MGTGHHLLRLENHEIVWFTSTDYTYVETQEGTYTADNDGSGYSYQTATGDNDVTRYMLSVYPPISPSISGSGGSR